MTKHSLRAHSLHTYVQWGKIQDNGEDLKAYRLCEALKAGTAYVDAANVSHDPGDLLLTLSQVKHVGVLGPRAWLVPIPRSTKTLTDDGSIHADWPALYVCKRLAKMRLGTACPELLRRTVDVPRSSKQKRGSDRLPVQGHIESIEADAAKVALIGADKARPVILVDDTLTRGTTMMGSMRVLRLAGLQNPIEGVAVFASLWDDDRTTRRWRIDWEEDVSYPSKVADPT